jgi:hypothetical protein
METRDSYFHSEGSGMKLKLSVLSLMIAFGSTSTLVDAKGCVKGAVVGGAAGHVAGHHAVAGAAIGCAVGHHRAKVKARDEAAREKAAATNSSAASYPARSGDAVSTDVKAPSH